MPAIPKPVKVQKEPKRLQRKTPIWDSPDARAARKPGAKPGLQATRWGIKPNLAKTIARRAEKVGTDPEYLAWVRRQPCKAREIPGHRCFGPIDPHHAGEGVAHPDPEKRKTCDRTAIPICRNGHRDVECLTGPFKDYNAETRRTLYDRWIAECRLTFETTTQFVCWGFCYCSGVSTECACIVGPERKCSACSFPMRRIYLDTGEPVLTPRQARAETEHAKAKRCTKPNCTIHPNGERP